VLSHEQDAADPNSGSAATFRTSRAALHHVRQRELHVDVDL
jgi:hypothetical protein